MSGATPKVHPKPYTPDPSSPDSTHIHTNTHPTPETRLPHLPMTHMLLPSLCSRGIMGNLLKLLACTELEHGPIVFLDFERETISFLCFEFAFLSLFITVPPHSLSPTFSLLFLCHPSVCASMLGIQLFFGDLNLWRDFFSAHLQVDCDPLN